MTEVRVGSINPKKEESVFLSVLPDSVMTLMNTYYKLFILTKIIYSFVHKSILIALCYKIFFGFFGASK